MIFFELIGFEGIEQHFGDPGTHFLLLVVTLVISLSLFNFVVLITISLLHFYWALGGKSGFKNAIPTTKDGRAVLQPGKIACTVVALTLAVFAVLFLCKLELIRLWRPGWADHYGLFIISIIFFARAIGDFQYVGFTKHISTTTFGRLDTKYYSPLCLLLGINGIVIEVLIRAFRLL